MTASERSEALSETAREASLCERCPQLAGARTHVVFGAGDPDADIMFVGEAPGATEDREGLPFVGASGKLLDGLLEGIGLSREEVFITSVLKCRPPDNRDPNAGEIANCSPWLERQIEIIEPSLVVTLGNFATRLLRGGPEGIGKVRGREEIVTLGRLSVRLYPVFHPAAALYRRPNLAVLEEDFGRIPELARLGPPAQPAGEGSAPQGVEALAEAPGQERGDAPEAAGAAQGEGDEGAGEDQLGLF